MRPGRIAVLLSLATIGCAPAANHSVWAQAPSHSLENVGDAECRLILFEPK